MLKRYFLFDFLKDIFHFFFNKYIKKLFQAYKSDWVFRAWDHNTGKIYASQWSDYYGLSGYGPVCRGLVF